MYAGGAEVALRVSRRATVNDLACSVFPARLLVGRSSIDVLCTLTHLHSMQQISSEVDTDVSAFSALDTYLKEAISPLHSQGE